MTGTIQHADCLAMLEELEEMAKATTGLPEIPGHPADFVRPGHYLHFGSSGTYKIPTASEIREARLVFPHMETPMFYVGRL